MFDHVTLRVTELADATHAFAASLDALEIEQTTHTASRSVRGTSLSHSPTNTTRSPNAWTVRQIIDDPDGHQDPAVVAAVDLDPDRKSVV